ncbi:MAG: hypothetical protein IK031_03180 [Bacteroidales bacterium]|nr:hypothetical protein [Bacteroidales bacterium]
MRLHGILALAAAALLCCACNRTTSITAFTADDTVRLEIDGNRVFVYDAAGCQLSYNEQRREFRAMTDTMLDYFCITLDAIPAQAGATAVASISWSSETGELGRNGITLEAKRIKGDVIWLCDRSQHTAAVVRVLK